MRRLLLILSIAALTAFVAGPAAARQSTGQADTLLDVRFGDHVTYERAVIDLGRDEIPSDFVPYYSWTRLDGGAILHVHLPSVTSTKTTDGKGLGMAFSRYYVTRAERSGHLDVDFQLTDAAGSANVFYLNYPARIVVDVPLNGGNSFPKATYGSSTVVTQPRAGSTVGPDKLSASGYGRPFEARGVWRIKNASGEIVNKGSYPTTDWSATWGRYSFTAKYPDSMSGKQGTLEVGELSAKDGSFKGVSVPLSFR